jgi:cell division protein FtsZ
MGYDRALREAVRLDGDAGFEVPKPRVRVVGCGGAGGNSVDRLHRLGMHEHAETVAVNTDARHLAAVQAHRKLLIGHTLTKGLGAGGLPEIGQKAAELSREELLEHLKGSDLVFLTVGLGGGTGTGVAPEVARLAKESGAVVVSIATLPFRSERARAKLAHQWSRHLRAHSDTAILLDNNRLLELAPDLPLEHAFAVMDHLTCEIVRSVTDTLAVPDLINVDFADLRAVLGLGGGSTILCGEGSARDPRGVVASALGHPLLNVDTKGARGALVHITSGPSTSLRSVHTILEGITASLREDANVICGTRIARDLEGTAKVMTIVTGGALPEGEPGPA